MLIPVFLEIGRQTFELKPKKYHPMKPNKYHPTKPYKHHPMKPNKYHSINMYMSLQVM